MAPSAKTITPMLRPLSAAPVARSATMAAAQNALQLAVSRPATPTEQRSATVTHRRPPSFIVALALSRGVPAVGNAFDRTLATTREHHCPLPRADSRRRDCAV